MASGLELCASSVLTPMSTSALERFFARDRPRRRWRALLAHRGVELSALLALAGCLPGLVSLALDRPAPYRYAPPLGRRATIAGEQNLARPSFGARVSASSSLTRDNYDPAYLVDGVATDARLQWVSQRDPRPWVHVELGAPARVRRVALIGTPPIGRAQAPRGATVRCLDGAQSSWGAMGPGPRAHELQLDWPARRCTALRFELEPHAQEGVGVGVLEIEVLGERE